MRNYRKTIASISFIVILIGASMVFLLFKQEQILKQYNAQSQESLYPLSFTELNQIYQNKYQKLESIKIDNISTYSNRFYQQLLSFQIPFFLLSLFIVGGITLIIVTYCQNRNQKKMDHVINRMERMDEYEVLLSENKALNHAFLLLKQKFKDNLEDYRRLNSYLSHEQKNGLSILRANLEVDGQEQYLEQIDQLTDCIDDILTLSEKDQDTTVEVVDVAIIAAEVCDLYKKSYQNLVFSFKEEDHTEIYGKERWIKRAISNLIDNAIKYGQQKQIEVRVRNQKKSVIVQVIDHGIGIAEKQQDKIFSLHYRIDELKKDGYGIGLSLVNHVCELCGGYAYVESEKNHGSTFYLCFKEKE